MFLSVPEHGWILLNVTKYAWKCLNKLLWLYEGSNYNNITIIVTNIIMLEFLSARFVHPVALLPFNIFLNMSQNIRMPKTFNKLFSLTTMTLELSKYLSEQLGVFLNVKQQNGSWLKKRDFFKEKSFLYNVKIYQIPKLFKFRKFVTFSFNVLMIHYFYLLKFNILKYLQTPPKYL